MTASERAAPAHRPATAGLPPRAGLGLKPEHVDRILREAPDVGFFEVHAENYMGDGGPPLRRLAAVAERYPLSLHGVALSIGGPGRLDRDHLDRLRALVRRFRPASFSEHLAWSTHDGEFLNDLLPLPYTPATLDRVCDHVDEAQETLGLRLLLENPSTYVTFAESTIEETEFLAAVARRTGCGLLLDVNNVMVSAVNHGLDPVAYVDRFPIREVGELHLAGYHETVDAAGDRLLVDAHDSRVADDVMALFRHVADLTGPLATLIEWDTDVPPLDVLLDEALRADAVLAAAPVRARTPA